MDTTLSNLLTRIAIGAGAAGAASAQPPVDLSGAEGFVWQPAEKRLLPVPHIARVALDLIQGVDQQKADGSGEYRPLRARPSGQQRHALGCTGHGQILPW